MTKEDSLKFADGILLCRYIYQCAVHKTLNGVIEEWEIFNKVHETLDKLEEQNFDHKRLDELLFHFNMENAYVDI